jgi:hypothetical protein
MAFDAATLPQLLLLLMWTCFSTCSDNAKHPIFLKVISGQDILEELLSSVSLTCAPGLFEILQSSTPPTISFFKALPSEFTKRWGIYLLTLEKSGCRPKIYIGSGTRRQGVRERLNQYAHRGKYTPRYVAKALDDGYVITHKGLLCWLPCLLLVWYHFYVSSSSHWKLHSHASSGRCVRGHLTCLSCVRGTSASWNMTVCARIYHSSKLSLETSLSLLKSWKFKQLRSWRTELSGRVWRAEQYTRRLWLMTLKLYTPRGGRRIESMLRKTLPRSKQLGADPEQRARSRGNGTAPFVTTRATNRLR